MWDNELEAKRDYKVTKSNQLIQRSRHTLTVQQQKIIAYLVSKIELDEKDLNKYYEFDIPEFCKICDIQDTNNTYLRKTIKSLYDKESIEILKDGIYAPYKWINDYEIIADSSTLKVQIHFRMQPYLLELKKNFTSYALFNILAFKSKYSIAIYELLRSYLNVGQAYFELDDFREKLLLNDKYLDYRNFKKKVFDIALNEINKTSDIRVTYETVTKKRSIIGLKFNIAMTGAVDRLNIRATPIKELRGLTL